MKLTASCCFIPYLGAPELHGPVEGGAHEEVGEVNLGTRERKGGGRGERRGEREEKREGGRKGGREEGREGGREGGRGRIQYM